MARQEKPIRWKTLLVLLAVALGLGTLYRFEELGKKPMHTDEAILAMKTQEYWKSGTFEYDRHDYHGPFLHHLTKWVGRIQGWTPDALSEAQLRLVTAVCGLLLMLTPLLFMDVIGRTGAGVAALLLAVSPMMAYYSRYYIMETPFVLLVALFIAVMWQWSKKKNKIWVLPAGVLLGLMHATKETFVLNIAAIAAGCAVVKMMGLRFEINERGYGFRSFTRRPKPWWAWVLFTAAAALTSVWMFSNRFHDWQYVTDSVRTYESYLGRSQGAGGHEKPWDYYLTLIFWRRQGFLWTQALIGGLAIVGMLNAFLDRRRADHKRAILVALSTYAISLLIIYSVIPYKTPWSVMGVVYAFALLAGLGARTIFRAFTDVPAIKFVLAVALAGGIYNLCRQTSYAIDLNYIGETRYAASEAHNPYAYSHTVPNLVALSARIHELARKNPAGKDMPVQIIQSEQGWPLPWYLRDLTHVGYQSEIPATIDAPVVVIDADREAAVRKILGEGWESSTWGLRAGITLTLLVNPSPTKKEKHAELATSPELVQGPVPVEELESAASAAPAPAVGTDPTEEGTPPAPGPTGTPLPMPAVTGNGATPAPTVPPAPAPPSPPASKSSPKSKRPTSAPAVVPRKAEPVVSPKAEPVPPKAQLVEDEAPSDGPPVPPPPAPPPASPSKSARPKN